MGFAKETFFCPKCGKGNDVDIIANWSDGKNTSAQLAPDRWAANAYDGQTLMQLD